MILKEQVEMEGFFFILFLASSFCCGILFIGYFQQSNGLTCQLTEDYLTGQFILNEHKIDSNIETDSNLIESRGHITLPQSMIDETNRVKQKIANGDLNVYPIIWDSNI